MCGCNDWTIHPCDYCGFPPAITCAIPWPSGHALLLTRTFHFFPKKGTAGDTWLRPGVLECPANNGLNVVFFKGFLLLLAARCVLPSGTQSRGVDEYLFSAVIYMFWLTFGTIVELCMCVCVSSISYEFCSLSKHYCPLLLRKLSHATTLYNCCFIFLEHAFGLKSSFAPIKRRDRTFERKKNRDPTRKVSFYIPRVKVETIILLTQFCLELK